MLKLSRPTSPRAFTLIEVTVVVVILVLLASLTVPRLAGTARKEFDHVVDQVADLLLMYAQRDQLGRGAVGLTRVRNDKEGVDEILLVKLESYEQDERTISQWVADPLTPPVRLPSIVDRNGIIILIEGEPVDLSWAPVTHQIGEDRPTIEITLRSIDGEQKATLLLSPHALAPERIDQGAPVRTPLDLDAAGRSREEW